MLGAGVDLMADVIVNHVSSQSPQFLDYSARGDASPYAGMFLTRERVFPGGASEADLRAVYRPRPGLPFTEVFLQNGEQRVLWTTFTPQQIDIDVHHPEGARYLQRILEQFAALYPFPLDDFQMEAIGTFLGGDSVMVAALGNSGRRMGGRLLKTVKVIVTNPPDSSLGRAALCTLTRLIGAARAGGWATDNSCDTADAAGSATSFATTMMRSFAEYFGWQAVRVRRFSPVCSSTVVSFGLTANQPLPQFLFSAPWRRSAGDSITS